MILKSGKLQKKLERQGWDVDADISGFQQPGPIGKFIPDIRARKRENQGRTTTDHKVTKIKQGLTQTFKKASMRKEEIYKVYKKRPFIFVS